METINVFSTEFETADRHHNGMATEDSALPILGKICKSLKLDYLQRVISATELKVGV